MTREDLDNVFDDDFFEEEAENKEIIQTSDDGVSMDDLLGLEDVESDAEEGEDIISSLLKTKGIVDGKIKFLNEEGKEESIDFSELSVEEQLSVLNKEPTEQNLPSIDQEILNLQNYLDQNNISINQYLEHYKNEVLEKAGLQQAFQYQIDAYTDEELYLLDLQNKYELSEEELVKELEKELEDKELFKRKTAALRKEYQELEDRYAEAEKQEFEKQQQEQYDTFANNMVEVATNTSDLFGFELDYNEKNAVLATLLELDENGTNEFYRSLSDPNKLYKMAWFAKYGEDAFRLLEDAYESEITKYKKKDSNTVVVKKDTDRQKSIHELY